MISHIQLALFVLCGLPLLIYPGILMAGIMGLAAPTSPNTPLMLLITVKTFLISSLLYPVGYFLGAATSFRHRALGLGIVLAHLSVCLISFAVWYALSK